MNIKIDFIAVTLTFMMAITTSVIAKDCVDCKDHSSTVSADKVGVKIEKEDSLHVCDSITNLKSFKENIKNLENKLGLPKGELFNHYQSFNCADAEGIHISLIERAIDGMEVFESTDSLAYFYKRGKGDQIPQSDIDALREDDEGELADAIILNRSKPTTSIE